MNNFAITSAGIGEALQRSAAALAESGNTLDESIGLVTAANSVIQNPEQVGTALKTLALRLRGTKTELEEAGEDTDGMAESVSQLQAKLKALTHGKVDIMLDPDTYKNPTQILREMADAWQDMTDIERSAALELMGGKRQGNILASIIKNFDTVEQVIQTSMDAEGSAYRENEKYLDSIQGKTDILTNSMQTLWSHALDSDFIKFLLDIANAFVKITDQAGLLKTALAAAFSFKTFKNKGGLFDFSQIIRFDENASSLKEGFSFNKNSYIGKFGKFGKSVGTSIGNFFKGFSKQATNAASDVSGAMNSAGESIETVGNYAVEADGQLSMFNNTQVASATAMRGQAAAANGAATGLKGLGIGAKVAGVGIRFLNAALNMLGAMLLSIAISKIIENFYEMANAAEETAQRASEAISKYNDAQKTLESQKKTVDELASSYKKLSSGVNTSNNKNIGLTTESYAEYLDVCNQIADMFPQLISGYDSEGNAILTLKGKVEELTKAYEDSARAAASQFLTKDNKEDIWGTYNNTMNEDAKKKWYGAWKPTGSVSAQKEMLDFFDKLNYKDFEKLLNVSDEINSSFAKGEDRQPFFEALSDLGYSGEYLSNGKLTNLLNDADINFEEIAKQIEDGDITLTDGINTLRSNISVALSNVNSTISSALGDIKQTVSAKLLLDSDYQKLDSNTKSLINTIINNLDADMISQMGANSIDDIYTNIMSSLRNADQGIVSGIFDVQDDISDAIAKGDSTAFKSAKNDFDNLIPKDWKDKVTGEILVDESADAVTQYLQRLAQQIQEESKNFEAKIQMQIDFESETNIKALLSKYVGENKDEIEQGLKGLNLGDVVTMKDIYTQIAKRLAGEDGKLRTDELDSVWESYSSGELDYGEQYSAIRALHSVMLLYGTDIDTVKSKLVELGLILPSLKDIPSFDLSTEATQKKVTKFQDDIEAIKEAWNSLNSKEMTKSDFIELATDYPELLNKVDLNDDNWIVQAKQALEELYNTTLGGEDGFIESLKAQKEAMESRGEDTSVVDAFIGYAEQLQNQPIQVKVDLAAVSDLTSAYEDYKTILESTNEIVYDGQEVSQDYKDSLIELGIAQEYLNECFDSSNPLMVKNATLLKKLVSQQKANQQATVRMAKAQTQLQYARTLSQMKQVIAAMEEEYRANGIVSNATQKTTNVLREQLVALKQAIQQYSLLELKLSDAANAFDEFEAAKNRDAELTYGDSMVEMLETINEGFITGKVGSEAFQAAVKALVPESVYKDIDDLDARMMAIHDYIDKDTKFADYFTIDEDGNISVTMKNIEAFVKDCQDLKLFTAEDENGNFELSDSLKNSIQPLKDFADALGVTESAALAMLSEFEKYDSSWGNIITDLTTTPIDKELNSTATAYEEALNAKENYIKSGKDLSNENEEWQTICQNVESTGAAFYGAGEKAKYYAEQNNKMNAVFANMNGQLELSKEEAEALARSMNIEGEISFNSDGSIDWTDEQLAKIQEYWAWLQKYPSSVLDIQLRYDEIPEQIDALQRFIDGNMQEGDSDILLSVGIEIDENQTEEEAQKAKDAAQKKLDELKLEKKTIEVTTGITSTTTEQDGTIEKLMTWESNGLTFGVNANTTEANAEIDETKKKAEEPTESTHTIHIETDTSGSTSGDGFGGGSGGSFGKTNTSSGSSNYTVDVTLGTNYANTIASIKALEVDCATPIEQDVDVSDNETIEDVSENLTELDEQVVDDKDFEVSDEYSINTVSTKVSNLQDQLDNLPDYIPITIDIQQNGSIPSGASGALGNARAMGSSHAGLPKDERNSIVGEVGEELVVDPYKGIYYTVGQNGTEMVNLPKGAIIYNHKQTKELLQNGHTSRGKLTAPLAFAQGNAHYGLFNSFVGKDAAFADGFNKWVDAADSVSSAADSLSGAADSVSDAADEAEQAIDFIEYRLQEIENVITKTTSKIATFLDDTSQSQQKKEAYDLLIDSEKTKAGTYWEAVKIYTERANNLLAEIPAEYQALAQNGGLKIADFIGEDQGEIATAIEEYREWAQKAADAETGYYDAITEIAAKSLEKLNDIADDYDNVIDLNTRHSDLIQGQMDLLEEKGERLSPIFYNNLIETTKKNQDILEDKRAAMQQSLNDAVKKGDIAVGTDEWYEAVNAIYDVDDAIIECQTDVEKFQNAINDLYWDNLDKLIDQIDSVESELESLYDIVADDEKVVDEFGNWTAEGITALGLLAQQIESANFKVKQYGEAISHLEEDYKNGLYSTDEYNEKLAELKEKQWAEIKTQEQAKKSLIDLNKTRIEAVKDGIQKEIDAYSELINKKKEELQLQKDAHDFAKQVAEKQKSIADIQKKLAAMAGDNSAATNAERKKLQEELYNAQSELEELYYNHSIEKQQDALDESLENYEKEKQDEMDALDEYLKDEEKVIADSYEIIKSNTEQVVGVLTDIANEYGVSLSDAVIKPWEEGANAIGSYLDTLDVSSSAFTSYLEGIKQGLLDLQNVADETATKIINATNQKEQETTSAKYEEPQKPSQPTNPPEPEKPAAPTKGSTVTVKKTATNFTRDGGNGTRMQSWVPGYTFTVYQVDGSEVLIGLNGVYTGWVKLSDLEGYAKGSKSISKDQLAMLDELGEELVLNAGANGRLQYMTKGSGVIAADLTERLMEWGQLDPSKVLEQSKPSISAPGVINNEFNIDMSFGSLVHVDSLSESTLPELQKLVRSEFDNCVKKLNNSLKRFAR